MNENLKQLYIMFGVGMAMVAFGMFFFRREQRLFREAVKTSATVVDYTETTNEYSHPNYTMVVEYHDQAGRLIRAEEQSSSNRKKYPVGAKLDVTYSREKPDFFIVAGDNSRKIFLLGMVAAGVIAMIVFGRIILTQY
jgi:hypothetical protein